MKSDFEIVTSKQFVAQYMNLNNTSFIARQSPIEIYPLNAVSNLIKAPTPLFRTEYNILILFSGGGAQQQIDNDTFNFTANDVLFIREGHLNTIRSVIPLSTGYFIAIDNSILPQIFPENILSRFTFHPQHKVNPSDMNWMCRCADLLFELDNDNEQSIESKTHLLKAIVLKLSESSSAMTATPDRQTEIALRFKEFLYQHFKNNRTVKFYAEALSVSENYLNRCVKHVTGKPPKQHINEVVIYHSQALLHDRSKDIAQIAFELNFTDPSYFGRLFKQVSQQTPTEYRLSLSQDLSE